jgi:hypothetical protein
MADTCYTIGRDPWRYQARRVDALNLEVSVWREIVTPKTGERRMGWASLGRYASDLRGALRICMTHAQMNGGTVEGAQEILGRLDEIADALSNVTAT